MFCSLPPAQFGSSEAENAANLHKLGDAMSSSFDPHKDGKDDEESGIPALYTYLGQFIDHDITFDPASSLQKQNDPDALTDFRTPAFDLDNVYGRGPDDQPYMYNGQAFLLGDPLKGGDANAVDLPRNNANPRRALIGDPRNDENTIVSQLQGLLLRFHNRTLQDNPGLAFENVQRLVRFHYQYVVINDFLPRIVDASVLNDLESGDHYDESKLKFYHWKHEPFMPIEFSVAAPTTIRAFVQHGMQTTFRFAPGYLLSFPCSATWVIFKYLSRNAIQLRAVLPCSGCARTLANHQQHGRRVWECATTMPSQWSSLPREKTAEGVATQVSSVHAPAFNEFGCLLRGDAEKLGKRTNPKLTRCHVERLDVPRQTLAVHHSVQAINLPL